MTERPGTVASGPAPWATDAAGLTVSVRLTPKGGRDAIDGCATLADGHPVLKIRVRAAPTEGEANAALIALIAKSLRVPAGQVNLLAGATSRIKRIRIAGDGVALATAMEKIAGGG